MPGRGPFKQTAHWPEPDRTLWAKGLSPASRLRATGHAARWRPGTVSKIGRAYATWLNWQREKGHLAENETPAQRISVARLDAYRAHLDASVGPVTVRLQFVDLQRAFSVLAPGCDVAHIKAIARCYPKKGDPLKKRARIQEPARLLQLGLDLMDAAEAQQKRTRRSAVVYRDGLIIALLAYRMPRLGNLTSIEMAKHLRASDQGWTLSFEGIETKNRKSRVTSWPSALDPHLATYLEIYRPLLLDGRFDGKRLWLSERPGPLTENGIYYAITTRTRTAFGKSVNPHLFRDAAATSVAVHDPENVHISHHVLGNGFATSQDYYNQARSLEASISLNVTIDKLRKRRRRCGK